MDDVKTKRPLASNTIAGPTVITGADFNLQVSTSMAQWTDIELRNRRIDVATGLTLNRRKRQAKHTNKKNSMV
jgi:hypothetical protein